MVKKITNKMVEKAKALTIKVWDYLAKHPECRCKDALPESLFLRIKNLYAECPLCELFLPDYVDYIKGCTQCPLKIAKQCCLVWKRYDGCWETSGNKRSLFVKWESLRFDDSEKANKKRAIYAAGIRDIVKGWKI